MKLGLKLVAMAWAIACLAGCDQIVLWDGTPPRPAPAPQPAAAPQPAPGQNDPQDDGRVDYMGATAVAGGADAPGQGAVARALDYADKWAKSEEECRALRQAGKDHAQESKRLLAQVARLEMQLAQSRKELDEANEMLLEMGSQLRDWKNNVTGFQKEIRQYFQAVIGSQQDIMKVLGAEVADPVPPAAAPQVSAKGAPADASKATKS